MGSNVRKVRNVALIVLIGCGLFTANAQAFSQCTWSPFYTWGVYDTTCNIGDCGSAASDCFSFCTDEGAIGGQMLGCSELGGGDVYATCQCWF
jgi:hypothetical protein